MNKILIFITIVLLIFSSCKKEEENSFYTYNSRSVDENGGTISFYENDTVIPENLIVRLIFEKNIVNKTTVINMLRLKKSDFPDFTNYAFYPLTDIISFSSSNNILNGKIKIEIPYKKIITLDNAWNENGASNNLLYNKQHLFKLYKIPNNNLSLDSIFKFNNWTEVTDFEIDSINSIVKFNIDNFKNKYIFVFPESKRQDMVISNVISNTNVDYGYYFSFSYLNTKYPYDYDMGFVHVDDCSHYNISVSKVLENNSIADIYLKLSIKHNGVGTFTVPDVKLTLLELNTEDDGILYGIKAENFNNLVVQITEFGDIGEKVKGKIIGAMKDIQSNNSFNIEILFDVIRTR